MMNDMMGLLRRRSLFDDPREQVGVQPGDFQFPAYTPPTPQPEEDEGDRLLSTYKKIVGAQSGEATQKYKDFLANNLPNEDNFRPTKTQRLSAILAGIHDNFGGRNRGAEVTESMLSEPYDKAITNYKMQASKLKEAADVEEKDIGNRVKTYRDIVTDQKNERTAREASRLNDARIRNYDSQIKERDATMATKGYTATTNKITGNRIYTRVGSDGNVQTLDSGIKVDQTPDEKMKEDISKHRITAGIDLGARKNYFDFTDPKIAERNKNQAKFTSDLTQSRAVSREERAHLEWAARQEGNPQRQFAQRALALMQIADENPEIRHKIDFNKYTTDDPDIIAKMNAKVAAMNTKAKGAAGKKPSSRIVGREED